MKIKMLFLSMIIIPVMLSARSSDEKENSRNSFGLGIVPQYAAVNGMRMDFDIRLSDRNHWLVLAPQMYLVNENANRYREYNSMTGAGMELQHKIYLNKNEKTVNTYFSYGPVFNYFSIKDNGLLPNDFSENGANYIGLIEGEMTTRIFKTGGNAIFGIQFLLDNLYLDIYAGTGIRFSYDNKTSGLHKHYNDWWGEMGYSGTLMTGGIKLGVMF